MEPLLEETRNRTLIGYQVEDVANVQANFPTCYSLQTFSIYLISSELFLKYFQGIIILKSSTEFKLVQNKNKNNSAPK